MARICGAEATALQVLGHGVAPPRSRNGWALTERLLAYNWFGDSFFEASCRLGGKTAGRCL